MQQFIWYIIAVDIATSLRMEYFIQQHNISVLSHFHWTPTAVGSKALYCSKCCSKFIIDMCIAHEFATDRVTVCCKGAASKPFWTFPEYSYLTGHLSTEYINGRHVLNTNNYSNVSFYFLEYNDGHMTSFPENICKFSNIVDINLSSNNIENLINLSCLQFLDTLDLRKNYIKTVTATDFSRMSYLRSLDLSYNLISHIEPGAFQYHPRSLAYIILHDNRLVTIDISNLVLGYFFRVINYRANQLSTITNVLNWKGFSEDSKIGGGWINLQGNNFTRIPSLSQLGFTDINSAFRGIFNYQLFATHNPVVCDCLSYVYVNAASQATIHFDGLDFECANPPSVKGYSALAFRKDSNLVHLLICNITLEDKCPPRCNCFKQPSKNRVVVNCSSSGRAKMPKVVPELDDLDINLSHNMIRQFENVDYLHRSKKIDLSYNQIIVIDPAIYNIKNLNFISFHHNKIKDLHRSIQLKNPCKIWFGNITLTTCKCEMRWMRTWLERSRLQKCAEFENIITCKNKGKDVDIISLSGKDLCSVEQQSYILYVWMSIIPLLILGICVLIYFNFRYEIQLLIRKNKAHVPNENVSKEDNYDAYLSFNGENEDVRNWTVRVLNAMLKKDGYRMCIPLRDFDLGGVQEEQIRKHIASSRSFIVVLSHDYEESHFQTIEWNQIWNSYKSDLSTTLIVINYDILKSKDIQNKKLKAFLRLGYCVDFCNFDNNLIKGIEGQLGHPGKHNTFTFSMEYTTGIGIIRDTVLLTESDSLKQLFI
jgi:Leucine-rich repeat (LRR) protein